MKRRLGNSFLLIRTGLLILSMLVITVSLAVAATWVGNRVTDWGAWQPSDSTWVVGQPKGYSEGETAPFYVEVTDATGGSFQFDICFDYTKFAGGPYAFTGLERWDVAYSPTLPLGAPITDMSNPLVYASNATIDSVIDLGPNLSTVCHNNVDYLPWQVQFTMNAGTAYIVFGGHLAAPGDPLPTGGVVPDGKGASQVSGVFQWRLGSEGQGDKTINFKGGLIFPPGCVEDEDCDNGVFCDGPETCDAEGTCQVGILVDCSYLDDQCNEGVCDEGLDSCVQSPLPDETPCNDGLYCTDPDTCTAGVCDGPSRDCDDHNICTDDSCDEVDDECDNVFDVANAPECEACYGVVCGDGLWCNGLEACDPATGQCVDGTPPDCSDTLFCTVNERCDEAANACVSDPRDCSDDLFCTVNETCDETADACVSDPRDCSDTLFCTVNETCDEVVDACMSEPRNCSDADICTDDSCDEAADICVNEFDETNDASCVVAPVLSADGNARCTAWWVDFSSDVTAEYYIRVKLDGHTEFVEKGTFIGSKSFRDDWDLKGSGIRTMRITYWVKAGGDQVGEDEIRTRNCGTPPAGPTPTPVPPTPTPVPPTPTPIVEVLGVERLPVTGGMGPILAFPSLRLILSSLALISGGFLLRRKE